MLHIPTASPLPEFLADQFFPDSSRSGHPAYPTKVIEPFLPTAPLERTRDLPKSSFPWLNPFGSFLAPFVVTNHVVHLS